MVLTRVQDEPLRILLLADSQPAHEIEESLQQALASADATADQTTTVTIDTVDDLIANLESTPAGTLLLPMEYAELLEHYAHSVILVPSHD